ncbi:DUF2690 domain-containing protein [Nocardia takedensis]|uniref:DUF2690 domain-containing protein n=1 Tax=Nocardia takedensis TaxID=259390 RepID=UPI0002E12929|nr:DUF2690 domain-containing protein [Nocardia takedensis]
MSDHNDGPNETGEHEASVETFAADLLALKKSHEDMSYGTMSRRAGRHGLPISPSTLHNAVNGRRMATARTVRAFVVALTGDSELAREWIRRRNTLADTGDTGDFSDTTPAMPPGRLAPTTRRSWVWWAIAAAVLISTNVLTAVLATSCEHGGPPQVHTGDDPGKTVCIKDAVIAASSNSKPQMLLEILFSHACDAGWARITRYDNAGLGNRLEVSLYRRSNPTGPTRQNAIEPDVDSAYTTLIIRTDPTDRLCATAAVTTGAHTEPVAQPICT